MDALRYLSIDLTPMLCVVSVGAAVFVALRMTEAWAARRSSDRTRRAVEEVERERKART